MSKFDSEPSAPTPGAMDIERLCVVMSASVGVIWAKLDADQARSVRVMASAALTHMGAAEKASAMLRFKDALEASTDAQRAAGSILDSDKHAALVDALFKGAAATSNAVAILDGVEVPDDGPAGGTEEF